MNNCYHRDKEGNWFIEFHGVLTSVEFSASMEIAYIMGRIAEIDKLRGGMNETIMQIRTPQMGEVPSASLSRQ